MPKLSQTSSARENEQSAPTGSSKIARWSRMAIFASALSTAPACAPNNVQAVSVQPQYPHPTQVQQATPQAEITQTQVPTTVTDPGNLEVQAESNKDPEAMLATVISNPMMLNEVDPNLKGNRNFMRSALEKTSDPSVFVQLAPEWVKQDKEMMMLAVQRNWVLLQFADDSLKSDQLFMMRMVLIDGRAIKYGAEILQKDRAMALAAVTQNGLALESLRAFSGDEEIVLIAIRQNPSAFQFADEKLRYNSKFLMIALRQPTSNDFVSPLKSTSPKLQKNRLVALTAIKQYAPALEFADPILKKDRGIVLAAAQQDEFVLEFADPSIREAVRKEIQAKEKYEYSPSNKLPKHIPAERGEGPKLDLSRLPD